MEEKKWIEPQIGYVVEIPNQTSVIINIGSTLGFVRGDKIAIFEKGQEIIDPQTNEFLGRRDYIKQVVEIVEIYPSFSICKHIRRKNLNSLNATIGGLLANNEIIQEEELNVQKDQVKNWKIKDSTIKINDPVKKY